MVWGEHPVRIGEQRHQPCSAGQNVNYGLLVPSGYYYSTPWVAFWISQSNHLFRKTSCMLDTFIILTQRPCMMTLSQVLQSSRNSLRQAEGLSRTRKFEKYVLDLVDGLWAVVQVVLQERRCLRTNKEHHMAANKHLLSQDFSSMHGCCISQH